MEAKPTRMLLLQLTDGSLEIGAMEYHTIPFLSTEIPPGIKVRTYVQILLCKYAFVMCTLRFTEP